MALRVEQEIAGFEVSVNEFTGMHVLEGLQELVDNELLVYFLQDAGPDDDVQVYLGSEVPVSMKSNTR